MSVLIITIVFCCHAQLVVACSDGMHRDRKLCGIACSTCAASLCIAIIYICLVSPCIQNPFLEVYSGFETGLMHSKFDVLKQFPDSRHNFDPTAARSKIDELKAEMWRYEDQNLIIFWLAEFMPIILFFVLPCAALIFIKFSGGSDQAHRNLSNICSYDRNFNELVMEAAVDFD